MDYQKMRRIPVDPRVIKTIQRSPTMQREQGGAFMSGWGGPQRYQQLAGLPMEQRVCYAAILEEHTTEDQIGIVTGLTPEQVAVGLDGLEARGLVTIERA